MGVSKIHTHFSATAAMSAFFAVLLMGTFWRLIAMHLAASQSNGIATAGRVMLFQY